MTTQPPPEPQSEPRLYSCNLKNLLHGRLDGQNTEHSHGTLRIPSYQRSYSWTESQVRDLLKDTAYLEKDYLMGTVILHCHQEGDKTYLDIVDSQQRLVTLCIYLYCLNA